MQNASPARHGASPDAISAIEQATVARLRLELTRPLASGLYIVATPIGHLADLTLRAIATLATVDVVYAEDTRHSRPLLDQYGIKTPLKSYHEHNGEAVRPEILDRLSRQERVALISDAGTPLISDPGYKLVRTALDQGFQVSAIPGASSVMAALSTAGLPTNAFHFAGFLASKDGQRLADLGALAGIAATLVLFEAPGRLVDTLKAIAHVMPQRLVVVARELTKLHETLARGLPSDLAQAFELTPPRGEIVLLIEPPNPDTATPEARIEADLKRALQTMSVRDAAAVVAQATGLPKKQVYQQALLIEQSKASDEPR